MLRLSMASASHWTKESDCTPENLSIGTGQTFRIDSAPGHAKEAKRYGVMCVERSPEAGVSIFFRTHAYEAVAGNRSAPFEALKQTSELAEQVEDPNLDRCRRKTTRDLRGKWIL
ncbi:hypothetical protein JW848_00015 [Candidatus Bipolaricaulota bacterium]|nr:hypothetical protein [Candidatus Bipolaricaulota bacterium]